MSTEEGTVGYTVFFDECTAGNRARLGGKNASLVEMTAAGLPVPPGFAVTVEAFETLRRHSGFTPALDALVAEADGGGPEHLEVVSGKIRALVEAQPMDPSVEAAVRSAYAGLGRRCDQEDVPVAVRSSADCEDLPDASFAGEHDTFLWVTGADEVVRHVARCWSSVWTARALSYRKAMGYGEQAVCMSVGVQQMVEARAAGVAFTLNPGDGDRSQVAIDAAWGLGEGVVGGEVTPDHFLVDKVLFEITHRTTSDKAVEFRVTGGRVERAEVEPERRSVPCLTDEQVKAVARLARTAERHYGCPQDVEWALESSGDVRLLQARSETVWSRKPRPCAATAATADPLASIVSTLMAPVHIKPGEDPARRSTT